MREALNLPNTLTTIRIILIPAFVTAIIYGRYRLALWIFGTAAATDALDGLAARLRNERTPLGTFLDPLADKFLIVTSFVLFSYYGWVPGWLTITVISRDIVVIVGWVLLYLVTNTLRVEPSTLGKAAIAMELILLPYILLNVIYGFLPDIKDYLIWATASLSVLSGVDYILKGLKRTGEK